MSSTLSTIRKLGVKRSNRKSMATIPAPLALPSGMGLTRASPEDDEIAFNFHLSRL